jgi:hypothetical protein
MKFFVRFRRNHKTSNIATVLERQRLASTMPGQTAAVAAARMGVLV